MVTLMPDWALRFEEALVFDQMKVSKPIVQVGQFLPDENNEGHFTE
jgi:hypothetical protein